MCMLTNYLRKQLLNAETYNNVKGFPFFATNTFDSLGQKSTYFSHYRLGSLQCYEHFFLQKVSGVNAK